MATLTTYLAGGLEGYITLTYSVSTANAGVTVSVSKIVVSNEMVSAKNLTYSVTLGGVTVKSGTVASVPAGGSKTVTISGSKEIERAHADTTKSLVLAGKLGTGNADSSSVGISVPARASYDVTYNANSGSGAPSAQTKWYDEALTLSSARPSRTNYVFRRWNTSTSDAGTAYSPGASYTANAALTLYAIWNPIVSYNTNGGGGSFPAQTKTYGQTLTLNASSPTRAGYTFLGWGTSASATTASYQPGGSYTSNSAITLYAVWRKDAVAPTISGISVVRSDSSGSPDDTGTYAKVTGAWSVDRTGAGMGSNTGVVTGQIVAQGGGTRTITWQSGASGTSGTATALISNCSTDEQYTVLVTVTNTAQGTGQSTYLATTRADILTRAFFTLDFANGGRGVGIGCAAPPEGFECAMDAQFDGSVTMSDDVAEAFLELASGCLAYDTNNRPRYSKHHGMVCVRGGIKPQNQVAAGGSFTIGTLPVGCRPSSPVIVYCKGTGYNSWRLLIDKTGVMTASHHCSGTANVAIPNTAFLPFSASFGT